MLKIALVLLFLFTTSFKANAKDELNKAFYLGIEHGIAKLQNISKKTTEDLQKKYTGKIITTQDKILADFRLFGGYKFTKNFEIEVGVTASSNVNTDYNGKSSKNITYRASTEFYNLGADYSLIIRPLNHKYFNNIFLRAGGTYYKKTTRFNAKDDSNTIIQEADKYMSFSNKGSGFIYGIGYDFNISDNFDLRLSYNYLKNIAGISYFHTNRFSVGILGKF
jgi:hypothetical protein